MEKIFKRVAILTSGGDSPGMNAAIRAVVRTLLFHNIEPVGVMRGLEGLFTREFITFSARGVANIIQRGGTMLLSSRCEKFLMPEQRAAAYLNLKRFGIDGLVAIGGNGTLKGMHVFTQEHEFPVMGLPGTIDNDVGGTDFCIGFDTALNTAIDLVDRLRDTAASTERTVLVEVMGRECGQIAVEVALACGAESVLLPHEEPPLEKWLVEIQASRERGKGSQIIIVAEGKKPGRSMAMADFLKEKLTSVRCCILGHVQRGGSPTARDRLLASRLGHAAVESLVSGKWGVMAGEVNQQIVFTPFKDCSPESVGVNQEDMQMLSVLSK